MESSQMNLATNWRKQLHGRLELPSTGTYTGWTTKQQKPHEIKVMQIPIFRKKEPFAIIQADGYGLDGYGAALQKTPFGSCR